MAKKPAAFRQKTRDVTKAHAELSQSPSFRELSGRRQFKETQRQARMRSNDRKWGDRW